jgi:hypothetical protein
MAKHLMVDMETLATTPNSVVLSLGAVHFDPYSNHIGDTLYFRINIDDQDSRHIDPDTIDWWSKQDPKIMEEAFSANDRIGFNDAINLFHKFAWGCDAFWSNGASFDLVIIEDMYRQIGKAYPWNFWQLRCTRTIFNLGVDPNMPVAGKHDALQDAIRQAIGVQNVFSALNIKPKSKF